MSLTAKSRICRSVHSWASEDDEQHMTSLRLPSPDQGSGAVCNKPTTAFKRSEDGLTGGVEALPALPEPFQTASEMSPASSIFKPAKESTLKSGHKIANVSLSCTQSARVFEASAERQFKSREETSAVQPVPSPDGELSHRLPIVETTLQDVVAAESVPLGMPPSISHLREDSSRITTPLSTSHGRAVSPPELPLGGPTVQAESRKAYFSPSDDGVLSPGLRESPRLCADPNLYLVRCCRSRVNARQQRRKQEAIMLSAAAHQAWRCGSLT